MNHPKPSQHQRFFEASIYKTRDLARADVFDYIEVFYNRTRSHSHLGGVSPEEFECAAALRVGFVHQTGSSPYLLAGVARQKQITVTMTHAILVSSEEFIARWVFGM